MIGALILDADRFQERLLGWHEHGVLESMVLTNLKRINYKNYKWFLGVYPNDAETLDIATRLQAKYPDKVTMVVTDKPGPTSKAHCLNCVLDVIHAMASKPESEGGFNPYYAVSYTHLDVYKRQP